MRMADDSLLFVDTGSVLDQELIESLATEGREVEVARGLAEPVEMLQGPGRRLVVVHVHAALNEHDRALLDDLLRSGPQVEFILVGGRRDELSHILERDGVSVKHLPEDTPNDEVVACVRESLEKRAYVWGSDLGIDRTQAESSVLACLGRDPAARGEKLELFLRFGWQLSRYSSLPETLDYVMDQLMRVFRCESGSIYLWDRETQELVLQTAAGPEREKRIGLRQKLGAGIAGWVAEVHEPLLVNDVRLVSRLSGRSCERYATHSCICAPIVDGEELYGVIALTMREAGSAFTEEDLKMMCGLCRALVMWMRSHNVMVELEQFNRELQSRVQESAQDIEQKEEEVRGLRALSQNIVESFGLGVIVYDEDLRVQFANTTARQLLASEDYEDGAQVPLAGLSISDTAWRRQLEAVLRNGEDIRLPRVAYDRGDEPCFLSIHGAPLKGVNGNATRGLLTIENVTEEVELEEKLMHSERLALVGRLASKVAHELNNPLDGILRFLSLARQAKTSAEKRDGYLEECKRALLRMASIITELLVFSRNQCARMQAQSVTDVIREAATTLEHTAHASGVRIEIDTPPGLPTSSIVDLDEIFVNLFKNAIEAMQDGGSVRVKAWVEKGAVRATVADDGDGVPWKLRARIFEAFYTTKKEGGGTGLGLAICRDILQRGGGDIELLPSKTGAVFRLTIPVEEETLGSD